MYTTCSELVVFMYRTGKLMNNLLSYCGLVDARIRASKKDLPVMGNLRKKKTRKFWATKISGRKRNMELLLTASAFARGQKLNNQYP